MNTCDHIVLDVISEPYLKGFSEFVNTYCITCFEEFEIEWQEDN
jgi:hypothetical protein